MYDTIRIHFGYKKILYVESIHSGLTQSTSPFNEPRWLHLAKGNLRKRWFRDSGPHDVNIPRSRLSLRYVFVARH
jgi:hypothetical protein